MPDQEFSLVLNGEEFHYLGLLLNNLDFKPGQAVPMKLTEQIILKMNALVPAPEEGGLIVE